MMRLILLAFFAFLAAACPPLLNDFTYLGNDTHSTTDLVRALFENDKTQLGWSEIATKVCLRRWKLSPGEANHHIDWLSGSSMARWLHFVLFPTTCHS